MAVTCVETAARLADQGIGVTVVDPRWVKPMDPALAGAAREHRLVVTVEDDGRAGGFGDAVCRLLRDAGVSTPVQTYGLPQEFLTHGKREEILEQAGLRAAAPRPPDHRGGGAAHAGACGPPASLTVRSSHDGHPVRRGRGLRPGRALHR